ncbi:MAG TPA: oligosaccharide flippase family protein [Acholeplasmataceae bacterium]|nr:oligosaccharide flippase family protein [Acholeplasmataceae bacterium]
MISLKKIYRNWIYLISSNLFTSAISFTAFIILARKMNVNDYGRFDAIIASITLFATFANNLAAGTVVNREISLNPEKGYYILTNARNMRIIGFIISVIVLTIYNIYIGITYPILLIAIALLLISNITFELSEQISFGYLITKNTTIISITSSIIWITIVLLIPKNQSQLLVIVMSYTIVFLFKSIIYSIVTKKIVLNKMVIYIGMTKKKLLVDSLPYLWMRLVGTLGSQLPILFLDNFSGSEEVAYYSVGNKLILPLTILITSGVNAFFPYLTRLYREDMIRYKKFIYQILFIVLFGGATIAFLMTTTSEIWLVALMGEKYINAVTPFNYQIWLAVCIGFDLIFSMILSSSFNHKRLAIITTVDIIILLPLILIFIKEGSTGLAYAKMLSSIISLILHMIILIRIMPLEKMKRTLIYALGYFVLLLILNNFEVILYAKLLIMISLVIIIFFIKDSPLKYLIANLIVIAKDLRKVKK